MPQARTVGENGLVMSVAVAGRLRDGVRLLLRPSGPLPRLSWRGQIFDVIVALGLGLAAILVGDEGDVERRSPVVVYDPGHPMQVPATPVPEPFLPIEHDQAGWTVVMLLVVVLPLVFRRRWPPW